MIHLSLGENCLSDFLLTRYKLKRESYTFGSVRTNIDYSTEIIQTNFKDLLDKSYLRKEIVTKNQEVVINFKYTSQHNIFSSSVSNGFEFTHHNILDRKKHLDSYIRKVERTQQALMNEDITFWYNYRYSKRHNLEILIKLFQHLENHLIDKYNHQYKFIIFTQVPRSRDKPFKHKQYDNIHVIRCFDKESWGGKRNIWAKSFRHHFDEIIYNYKLLDKLS